MAYSGDILALKHFKEDVKEVREGSECGLSLEKFNDIKINDILETFILQEVRQSLTDGSTKDSGEKWQGR